MHVRVRRWALRALVALVVAMAASGTWLAFRYEPGGGAVTTFHDLAGLVTVLVALAAAVATALDPDRSTAGVLPATVVLVIVAALYVTGPALQWDQMGSPAGPRSGARGVVDAFDEEVELLVRGEQVVEAGAYRQVAWLHAVALPVALLVMGCAGAWAMRRRAGAYRPRHAAVGDTS